MARPLCDAARVLGGTSCPDPAGYVLQTVPPGDDDPEDGDCLTVCGGHLGAAAATLLRLDRYGSSVQVDLFPDVA